MSLLEALAQRSKESLPRQEEIVSFVNAGLQAEGGKEFKARLALAREAFERFGARVEYSSGKVWITEKGAFSEFASFYL